MFNVLSLNKNEPRAMKRGVNWGFPSWNFFGASFYIFSCLLTYTEMPNFKAVKLYSFNAQIIAHKLFMAKHHHNYNTRLYPDRTQPVNLVWFKGCCY